MKRSGANLGNIRTPVKRQIPNVSLKRSGANLSNIRTPVKRQIPNVSVMHKIIINSCPSAGSRFRWMGLS